MGYTAKDESSYNKNKITLDRYNKLRSDYDDVIKNFNGINLIIGNPTARAYPYLNTKVSTSYIEKKYRDRKYLSFKNESNVNYEFTEHGTKEFDIPKGYYEVTMVSAGSGGFALYGNHSNRCAQYPGCSGSLYKFLIYIPNSGHMKVEVGKGGPRFIKADYDVGKWHREVPVLDGGNTVLYYNNSLVASCRGGGRLQYVFRKHDHDGDIEGIGIFDDKNKNQLGSYIIQELEFKDNISDVGDFNQCDKGRIKQMDWNYIDKTNFPNNGVGGCAWAKDNNYDEIKQYTKDGKDGYFKITSVNSSKYGYLIEGIDVETDKIHTLGNENEIRRKFNEALEKIYDKLYATTSLVKDNCVEIGIKTTEEAPCEPFSEDALEKRPYNMSYVKTTNENGKLNTDGTLRSDSYIITYDWDQKRKIELSEIDTTAGYTSFNYNGNIVYVKDSEVGNSEVDVYKLVNKNLVKQTNKGYFRNNPEKIYDSSTDGMSKTLNLAKGYYRVISIGAGGGGLGIFKKDYDENDWGEIEKTYVTATETEDHRYWMYVVGVHFQRGFLPILIPSINSSNFDIDRSLFVYKTDPKYSTNLNSAFYIKSQKRWIPCIAEDVSKTMVWYESDNTSVGMLVYSTATMWGWDDGHRYAGHPTVWTDKFYTKVLSDNRTLEIYRGNKRVFRYTFSASEISTGQASAAGGGGGAGFDCVLDLDSGTYEASVGLGGESKVYYSSSSNNNNYSSGKGTDTIFGSSIAYAGFGTNNTLGMVESLPEDAGGQKGPSGGLIPKLLYKIISTNFRTSGNLGRCSYGDETAEGLGGESLYGTYGKGGYVKVNRNGTYTATRGNTGYLRVETYPKSKLIYQNNTYDEYPIEKTDGVILWSDYQYDLQKLNRLKEYVGSKDSWFDSDGYCQRSCQINCQTLAQKSSPDYTDIQHKLM